jgi:anti-anti-sigma regulatory factor
MLKISVIESDHKTQLVLEGKLVVPWTDMLRSLGLRAVLERDHREIVVDVRGVTAISVDGEDVLLTLMDQGARFRASGVFMRLVLKELSRRSRLTKGINRRKTT